MTICIKLAAIITLAGASSALAQVDAYPNKPVRWVIPFAPGGGTDMVARPIAGKLTDRLRRQMGSGPHSPSAAALDELPFFNPVLPQFRIRLPRPFA